MKYCYFHNFLPFHFCENYLFNNSKIYHNDMFLKYFRI